MNRIILAYAHDNQRLAHVIDQNLSRIGIPFDHITDQVPGDFGAFAQHLSQTEEPVLLIVSDNFLKNLACMADLTPALQSLRTRNLLQIVVAPGEVIQNGVVLETIPTHFDRMVYALQYMKYWQNAWLDLSTQHLHTENRAEKQAIQAQLEIYRKVANEIGDLLSFFKETGYVEWSDLVAHDFKVFFQKFGLEQWHTELINLTKEAVLPHPLASTDVENNPVELDIPEISPLTDAEIETETALPEKEAGNEMPDQGLQALTFLGGVLTPKPLDAPVATPAPPDYARIKNLLEQMPDELEDEVAPQTDGLNKDAYSEQEIQQAIQDAWFWIEKGHVERGLELLQLSLDQHPGHPALVQALDQANARFPAFSLPEKTAQTPQIPEPVTPAPEPDPAPEPKALHPALAEETRSYAYMGDRAAEKGDYLFAKYCWDRVIELDPDYPGMYRKLALMTHEHLRDYRETTQMYLHQALTVSPGDPEILMAMAENAHQNGQLSAAETYYLQAIAADAALRTPDRDAYFLSTPREMSNPVVPDAPEALSTLESNAGPELMSAPEGMSHIEPSEPELINIPVETPLLDEGPHPVITEAAIQEELPSETLPIESETAEIQPVLDVPAKPKGQLTVLITGASSGIGLATATVFAENGHRVLLTGRRAERLDHLKQQLESEFNASVYTLPFDVRDQQAVETVLSDLPAEWQEIDVLINNAGLAKGLAPIHEGSLEHWETMIDTNLKGLLYVTRAIAPGMVKRGKGHIINLGSSAGKETYPNGNVYCATKFAVDALTKAMRMDLYTHNIRVSQVSPGHVEETEFAITRFDGDAEKANIYQGFQPLKARDVAETIFFIATRPAHVNIQDIWLFSSQQASSMLIDRSGR